MKKEINNFDYPDFKRKFPRRYYNNTIKGKHIFQDTVRYRTLVRTNPETFEYNTSHTVVDVYPSYKASKEITNTRIYIMTIDNAHLNLWLTPQPMSKIRKILKLYQGKRVIKNCVEEFSHIMKAIGQVETCPSKYCDVVNGVDRTPVVYFDFN